MEEFDPQNLEEIGNGEICPIKEGELLPPTVLLKGKPCINFQTIEFELMCVLGDYDLFFAVYDSLYEYLTKYQTQGNVTNEPLATDKQLKLLKALGIKVNEKTLTQKEAYNLIKENCGK